MKKCKILVQSVEMLEEKSVGITVQAECTDCKTMDRLMILHAVAKAIDLDSDDVMLVALGMVSGAFDSIETVVDLNKAKEQSKDEG